LIHTLLAYWRKLLDGEQVYPFPCHILEHEDAGMMINYKVVDPHG
jgi:FtsP/CotA-like multicopper oxidase with cupredoxin domain